MARFRPRRRPAENEVSEVRIGRPTPRWWVVTMIGLMILGLVWIVVFYLSQVRYPVPGWGNWNLVAGFGLILAGFAMTTRWR
ncbi:cell division protein CrgA [Kineococcus glutinatus]|uniref:Cell division protein CrgA n=1 Tax=Kineococcus glutinatus TaxID=1070872 RepID=A0ABP9HAV6_9ACTN